jgi:hypothetical protein
MNNRTTMNDPGWSCFPEATHSPELCLPVREDNSGTGSAPQSSTSRVKHCFSPRTPANAFLQNAAIADNRNVLNRVLLRLDGLALSAGYCLSGLCLCRCSRQLESDPCPQLLRVCQLNLQLAQWLQIARVLQRPRVHG